jgi:tRNA pseudouridine38-40 synthase
MRIAIGISYEGSPFEGWQSQRSGNTVQDRVENALGCVAGVPVRIAGAGRTDTGVHAVGQVAHFDCDIERPDSAWVRGGNSHLPPEIAIQWATVVPSEFHARFSALARSYRYVLYNHPVRSALASRHAGWFHLPLDIDAMRRGIAYLAGKHDFTSFRSSQCQAASPIRTIEEVTVTSRGPYIIFDITADAFLHHMVRNIVGTLIYVGKRRFPPEWVDDLLQKRDRSKAAPTISPAGLYLNKVRYAPEWRLPEFARMIDPLTGNGA